MALARCEIHKKIKSIKNTYVCAKEPVGYPETALICGRPDCKEVALLFLNTQEKKLYEAGARIFSIPTHAAKLCVK